MILHINALIRLCNVRDPRPFRDMLMLQRNRIEADIMVYMNEEIGFD